MKPCMDGLWQHARTHRASGVTPGTVAMAVSMLMAVPSSIMPCCSGCVCQSCVPAVGGGHNQPHHSQAPSVVKPHLAVHEAGVEPLAGHGLGGERVPHAKPRRDGRPLLPPQVEHPVLEAVAGGGHDGSDG